MCLVLQVARCLVSKISPKSIDQQCGPAFERDHLTDRSGIPCSRDRVGDHTCTYVRCKCARPTHISFGKWTHNLAFIAWCDTRKGVRRTGSARNIPGWGAVTHRDVNGASNICSRAKYGAYGCVQAQAVMYLRPVWRSRVFDTGPHCLEFSPGTSAL